MSLKHSMFPWVWGFLWRFPWVCVWDGYMDCDQSLWAYGDATGFLYTREIQ